MDDIDVSISGRMGRRAEFRRYRTQLANAGYRVVSSWLDGDMDDGDVDPERLGELQLRNLEDIDRSTLHLVFTEYPSVAVVGATRGTRHFDAGYAYTICRVVVIGVAENGAHLMPGVERFANFDQFFEDLTGLAPETDTDLGLDRIEP